MTARENPCVVVGVDESPIATAVLQRADEQARMRQVDLHVVHVTYVPVVYAEVPIDWTELAEEHRAAVWETLEPLLDSLESPVVRVDLEGYPPDTLVDYAHEHDAALIVVGTRGRGDLASLILGSTSHRAIHLATCDVLVVKATQDLNRDQT